MKYRLLICQLLSLLLAYRETILPASSEQVLGTNLGIPGSSPPILWPRGMSLEALSPNNLYPNGSQFGLSNTSGGFGMSGSGPISGVGLTQRSLSGLAQEELERPYAYIRRISGLEEAEAVRSSALFSNILGSQYRIEMTTTAPAQSHPLGQRSDSVIPTSVPNSDFVLQDRPASPDTVLRTNL